MVKIITLFLLVTINVNAKSKDDFNQQSIDAFLKSNVTIQRKFKEFLDMVFS